MVLKFKNHNYQACYKKANNKRSLYKNKRSKEKNT